MSMTLTDNIKHRFKQSGLLQTLLHRVEDRDRVSITGTIGSSAAVILSLLTEHLHQPLVCLLPKEDEARSLVDELKSLSHKPVHFFPAIAKHRWDEIGPPPSIVGRRLATLKKMTSTRDAVVVTSAKACLEKVASPAVVAENALTLHRADEFYFDLLVEYLVDAGYIREERVDQPGEMSVRGGIVDVYMYESVYPVRIEFFGDSIESIREFDVESQQSIRSLQSIAFIPPSAAGRPGPLDEERTSDLELQYGLLDFLTTSSYVIAFDYALIKSTLENVQKSILEKIEKYNVDKNTELAFEAFYLKPDALLDKLDQRLDLEFSRFFPHLKTVQHLGMQVSEHYAGDIHQLKRDLEQKQEKALIAIACDSDSQTTRMRKIVVDEAFPANVHVGTMDLSEGFHWPDEKLYVYTNQEIFDRKRLSKLDSLETRKVSFRELLQYKPGDYVVHTDYGIGIYRGLEHIRAYNRERECLIIEYKDKDILYVPLEKMDCVQKYSSRDSTVPSLSKLGGNAWQRLKKRAKQNVKEVAEQLIKLYAVRKMEKGFAFGEDTVWQSELEASFQYDETPDQLDTTSDIKKDMEKDTSMDRLVCGDVGFGKTEVAIRAAFKAINSNKQVAILVPTTVLAQQHFSTFSNRLRSFPVRVEMLSRFRSAKKQTAIIHDLKLGQIDLIIGTHRLLSKSIEFKELGLLIIDEEQKFGVLHKEKLKLMKKNVDTLTLSATPIPRTLQMALVGARDMSVINTPPSNRIPVKTEVSRFDKQLIREAILRETNRNGQVFFIHNRVQTIYAMATMLRELLPEVSFALAHGQMKADQLERVMMKFAKGDVQCLVTTMIIESGIDMPNANTMIINRADRFGLAQLYQLRGRVGRSYQQAYVYLLIPPIKRLNRAAIKRLQSIQEYTHLGSGYKIAMRDLEIRGAGNIFGAKQSGFVDSLGYEMYTKIIEEAIYEIKAEHSPAQTRDQVESRVLINTNAYLPEEYISSAAERVDIYKRLAALQKIDKIESLQHEVIDRFGSLPDAAQNLFDYVTIKQLCRANAISELSLQNHHLKGTFHSQYIPAGERFKAWIARLVDAGGAEFQLEQSQNELVFTLPVSNLSQGEQLSRTKNFLQRIS